MTEYAGVDGLRAIMARLRDPDGGCPWDREQTLETIVPFTIEEAYEVAEAVERGHWDDLRDELGDLLFHVVFYARMAEEARLFDFDAITAHVISKLVRRHPHVFGDVQITDSQAQSEAWEQHKVSERAARAQAEGRQPSVLDGIGALPGLLRAVKLQRRAARVGFDWDSWRPVVEKVREELAELVAEIEGRSEAHRVEAELGDLLFASVNLARHLGLDPEAALRGANRRFEDRFRRMERLAAGQGRGLAESSLQELEALWQTAKGDVEAERQNSGGSGAPQA